MPCSGDTQRALNETPLKEAGNVTYRAGGEERNTRLRTHLPKVLPKMHLFPSFSNFPADAHRQHSASVEIAGRFVRQQLFVCLVCLFIFHLLLVLECMFLICTRWQHERRQSANLWGREGDHSKNVSCSRLMLLLIILSHENAW